MYSNDLNVSQFSSIQHNFPYKSFIHVSRN